MRPPSRRLDGAGRPCSSTLPPAAETRAISPRLRTTQRATSATHRGAEARDIHRRTMARTTRTSDRGRRNKSDGIDETAGAPAPAPAPAGAWAAGLRARSGTAILNIACAILIARSRAFEQYSGAASPSASGRALWRAHVRPRACAPCWGGAFGVGGSDAGRSGKRLGKAGSGGRGGSSERRGAGGSVDASGAWMPVLSRTGCSVLALN